MAPNRKAPNERPVMNLSLPHVLVVGAGPVGLAMAAELARYQVKVRLIDKATAPSDKSKALVLWSRTLELLDRAGCAGAFIDAGLKASGASISAQGRRLAHIDLAAIDSPHPYALMLPQSETERLLAQHLAGFGITVERGVELADLTPGRDRVTARLRQPDGREEDVACDWLVGCDGAHSTVRHRLGMDFAGSAEPSDWLLADLRIAGPAIVPDEIGIFWHRDGVLAVFPITAGRVRVIADLGGAAPGAAPDLASVQAIVDRRGPAGTVLSDPIWLAYFRINERMVDHYRVGRVFLAGDAAHIHSPAGGQGMNTGIQDACNLAWKLALAVRGIGHGGKLLDSYDSERRAVGAMVLRNATRLTHAAVLRNPLGQIVRNGLVHLLGELPPVQQRLAATMTEIDIAYPDSPLNRTARGAPEGRGAPRAGERAPLDGDLARRIGAGADPKFLLVGGDGGGERALLERFGALVTVATPDATLPQKYGAGTGLWLIRPDGYIGLAAPADGWESAAEYLAMIAA